MPRFELNLSKSALLCLTAALYAGCGGEPAQPDEEPADTDHSIVTPSVPENATSCAPTPASSTTSGGKTYYRYRASSSISWMSAKSDCEAMGGKLATPTSSTENSAILGLATDRTLWIGVFQPWGQTSVSANWQNTSGAALSYTNWQSGQPNDSDGAENDGQNCTFMYYNGTDAGKWNDWVCYGAYAYDYVCEFSATPGSCGGTASCAIPSGGTTYSCTCGTGQEYSSTSNTCVDVPSCTTDATYGSSTICRGWDYNLSNRSTYITSSGTGVLTGVQAADIGTSGTTQYLEVKTTSVPNYARALTSSQISALNTLHAGDFSTANGQTSAVAGSSIAFGQNIGFKYVSGGCNLGYWPPGPSCPSDSAFDGRIPLVPTPASSLCKQGGGAVGMWLTGAQAFGVKDSDTYMSRGIWHQLASKFEAWDVDICGGHAQQQGNYHHHGGSLCLRDKMGDTGTGHSPIYGYAADGYPIYGPYHASGTFAHSCWKTRDYSTSGTGGCGSNGNRTCKLNNVFNVAAGTTTLAMADVGPTTSASLVTASGHSLTAASGVYVEDYYYDASCAAQGGANLDQYNGHTHGSYGYHYHITVTADASGNWVDQFPNHVGLYYYGTPMTQPGSNGFTGCDSTW